MLIKYQKVVDMTGKKSIGINYLKLPNNLFRYIGNNK